MSESFLFFIIIYLPSISFFFGTAFIISGIILKIKKSLYYKKLLFLGGIFFAISFIIFYSIILLILFYGIGPGVSDTFN